MSKRAKTRSTPDDSLRDAVTRATEGLPPGVSVTVEIRVRRRRERVEVPASLVRRLVGSSSRRGSGAEPAGREVTTQEAARILNVSRPFVVKLIETGKLPARKVGVRRRLREADVLAYRKRDYDRRKRAIDRLSIEAQELGFDD